MHRTLGFTAAFIAALAIPVFAETPAAPPPVAANPSALGAAGPRIVPPNALKPREQVGLLRTSLGLRKSMLARGGVMVDLQGRFREFMVASVDAQGVPHIGCMHDERAVRMVLEGRALPAPARFEER